MLPVDLNPITLPTQPFVSPPSKLIFDFNITWAPFLISNLKSNLPA